MVMFCTTKMDTYLHFAYKYHPAVYLHLSCTTSSPVLTNLEGEHQVHPVLAQRVDVIQNQSYDDVYTITLMACNGILHTNKYTQEMFMNNF